MLFVCITAWKRRWSKVSKTYSELARLHTFEERFEYLKIGGEVGRRTFGGKRWLNQYFYHTDEWKNIRNYVIARDHGDNLGLAGYPLKGMIHIHHIKPITDRDILDRSPLLLDPNNLITVDYVTHKAIHYGTFFDINPDPIERFPNDTCPWKN